MEKKLTIQTIKKINNAKKAFKKQNISFISQQCIGGIIYHDMEMKFLSPTINLYFKSSDFLNMVENLEYYMTIPLTFKSENNLIVGYLEDIQIIFLHYNDETSAKENWEKRKKRILFDKIFIICTDRDGFDDECFKRFKNLKYPKALITRNEKWKDEDFCIYLENYKDNEYIPDTIPQREFYEKNKIIELINQAYN